MFNDSNDLTDVSLFASEYDQTLKNVEHRDLDNDIEISLGINTKRTKLRIREFGLVDNRYIIQSPQKRLDVFTKLLNLSHKHTLMKYTEVHYLNVCERCGCDINYFKHVESHYNLCYTCYNHYSKKSAQFKF